MLHYVRLPLLFFFVASVLGVFLRWQFVWPTPGITYTYFLHGHSHTMFLGWVFNALYIAFTTTHIVESRQRIFKIVFIASQFLVVAMAVSFPIQGYGLYSIIFSTLHTVLAIFFVVIFFHHTKKFTTVSCWYARASLLFFLMSTLGPFSLGYLMANGMGQSNWYYFSIYYYLHFQYNGFFLFGVLSLFLHLLDIKHVAYDSQRARIIGWYLAGACIPAYLLSVLWAKPGILFNIVAGTSALVQVYAIVLAVPLVKKIHFREIFTSPSRLLLTVAFLALVVKMLLQFLSAFPTVAALAYTLKPIVIAYLHLVLIGIISGVLLVWYIELKFLWDKSLYKVIVLFLTAFVITEVLLVAQPWWPVSQYTPWSSSQLIFFFSTVISVSCILFYRYSKGQPQSDKNQHVA